MKPHTTVMHYIFAGVFISGVCMMGVGYSYPSLAQDETVPKEIASLPQMPFPDLTSCQPVLKNENSYVRGDERLAKFIHVGKDGWLYRSADFRMDFSMSEKTMNYMKRVNEALKRKGSDLYVILQPSRAMLEPQHIDTKDMIEEFNSYTAKRSYKALLEDMENNGIHTVDLSDPPYGFDYFLRGDVHWNYRGAKWSAEQVTHELMKNQYFQNPKKTEFTNEIIQWFGNENGLMEKFVEKACNVTLPPEVRPGWATTSIASESSESALFDEITFPDISIVGTSNTANDRDFNFVGFMKKFLSADIGNHALSAAGFSGASVVFYSSDEFQQHPPKIMLWEFLAHHDFADYNGFRQMIPAIEGPCDEKDAVASSSTQIPYVAEGVLPARPFYYGPQLPNAKKKRAIQEMHEYVVLDNLEVKKIGNQDSYLYLEVMNPTSRLLKVGILYSNGEAEQIDVSRSLRGDNNGKYYLEFNPDFLESVTLVQVETEKQQGDVKARICKYKDAKL